MILLLGVPGGNYVWYKYQLGIQCRIQLVGRIQSAEIHVK